MNEQELEEEIYYLSIMLPIEARQNFADVITHIRELRGLAEKLNRLNTLGHWTEAEAGRVAFQLALEARQLFGDKRGGEMALGNPQLGYANPQAGIHYVYDPATMKPLYSLSFCGECCGLYAAECPCLFRSVSIFAKETGELVFSGGLHCLESKLKEVAKYRREWQRANPARKLLFWLKFGKPMKGENIALFAHEIAERNRSKTERERAYYREALAAKMV